MERELWRAKPASAAGRLGQSYVQSLDLQELEQNNEGLCNISDRLNICVWIRSRRGIPSIYSMKLYVMHMVTEIAESLKQFKGSVLFLISQLSAHGRFISTQMSDRCDEKKNPVVMHCCPHHPDLNTCVKDTERNFWSLTWANIHRPWNGWTYELCWVGENQPAFQKLKATWNEVVKQEIYKNEKKRREIFISP